ncbi:MAG TPA: tannase/feruloyl esterase family alpha/beta hydrolase [Terracidiphilus sp.]
MRILTVLFAFTSVALGSAFARGQQASAPGADKCEALAKMELPTVEITTAKTVAAGEFVGPRNPFTNEDMSSFYKGLPAFCRVVAHSHPSSDSDIPIEVWMPLAGWNGKLEGNANGGFAGSIDYVALGDSLIHGYASTGTDTGHSASGIDAKWALGHPEKIVDFGNRGIHEMTRIARLIVPHFYGSALTHSYFNGCSDGGREALMEAQKYPEDYDGILAGAPANYWTGLLSLAVIDTQALTANPASFIRPAKIAAISKAVLAACDKLDGVADGVLNDPRQCRFNPATVQCKEGEDTPECLTAPQVTALKAIYAGLHDESGHAIFPGYLPGAEDGFGGWSLWITGPAPAKSLMAFFGLGYYSNMVYDRADWDYKTFSLENGLKAANEKTAAALNATNPDLSAFRARGGKLILYHGWNDPAIPALNTVNYYESVIAKMGQASADSFTRLYMVPGMQHCGGGPGPDEFGAGMGSTASDPRHNIRIALENWVEKGTAPTSLLVSKAASANTAAITRPLCPYPQAAKYKGTGDSNHAESFVCEAAKK